MGSSAFLKLERRKLKMECEQLPNLKPLGKITKGLNQESHSNKLIQNNHFPCY